MNRPGPVATLFLLGLLAAPTAGRAEAWCDVVFKDVATSAAVVVLARVEKPKGESGTLQIVEVYKGRVDYDALVLDLDRIGPRGLKDGDHLLLALTKAGRLAKNVPGMGACTPISAVAIRGGKLRPKDRLGYDSHRGALTLDEVRAEIAGQLGAR